MASARFISLWIPLLALGAIGYLITFSYILDPSARAARIVRSGNRLYANGHYDQAARLYTAAIGALPRSGEAHYGLALAQLKMGQMWDAEPHLTRAIHTLPANTSSGRQAIRDAKLKLEEIYFLAAIHPIARKQYSWLDEILSIERDFVAEDPNSFASHKLQGDLAYGNLQRVWDGARPEAVIRSDFIRYSNDAIDHYSKALALKAGDSEVETILARALAGMGRYEESERHYTALLDRDPHNTALYGELYESYLSQHRTADAVRLVHEAVSRNPENTSFSLKAATYLLRLGQTSEMTSIVDQVEARARRSGELFLMIGDFDRSIGQFSRAMEKYRAGLHTVPGKWPFRSHMVEALLDQGQDKEAAALRAEFLNSEAPMTEKRILKASLLVDQGDPDGAIPELQRLAAMKARDSFTLYYLGKAYMVKGDRSTASVWLNSALAAEPDFHRASVLLGWIACDESLFFRCAQAARQVLDTDINNLPARILLATELASTGQRDQVTKIVTQTQGQLPDSAELCERMGRLYSIVGQQQFAEQCFLKAYALDATGVAALRTLVDFYFKQNRPLDAVHAVEADVRKKPGRLNIMYLLHETAVRAHQLEIAKSALDAIVPRVNDANAKADLFVRLAEISRQSGDTSREQEGMRNAEMIAPQNVPVLLRIAQIRWDEGNIAESRRLYEDIHRLEPDNVTALTRLANIIVDENEDLNLALTYASLARTKAPNAPETLDVLGWVYLKRHEFDSAMSIFQGLVEAQPEVGRYWYHLGSCLAEAGDRRRALQALTSALRTRVKPSADETSKIRELIAANT